MSLINRTLATGLAYAIFGVISLALALPPGYASPVFPAAGIAIACALCFGTQILPGIWVGSLITNLAVAWHSGKFGTTSIVIAGVIAIGAVMQTWSAHWLVSHRMGDKWRHLESENDIAHFLFLAAPSACLVSATIGVGSLHVSGIIPSEDLFFSWLNWWTGDTLGVLITTPLALIFLNQSESPWRERRLTVTIPIVTLLILVVAAFLNLSHRQQKQQIAQIQKHGEILAQELNHRFIAHKEALSALKRLIEVTPDMTIEQFEYFTRITLQENKDISALSFNPYILNNSRHSFELSMSKFYKEVPYKIVERNLQKQLISAPESAYYIPVGIISPLEGNRPAIGFNINSEPIRRDAINKAIKSGQLTVTAPIQLVQEQQKRVGVLTLAPAYRAGGISDDGKTGNLIGFAVGVFRVDDMINIATLNVLPKEIVFRLFDPSADAGSRTLFQSDQGQNQPIGAYVWRTKLTMADRPWTLEVFPTAIYLQQNRTWNALGVKIAGLLFASLLQVVLLAMTGRTAVIQRKVNEQTEEIIRVKEKVEATEAQLRSITQSANDAILMMNSQGKISYCNPAAEHILGYKTDELLGKDLHKLLAPERFYEAYQAAFPEFQRTGTGNAIGKTLELYAIRKDDREIIVSLSLSAVLLHGSWHAVGIMHDITDRKKYERNLELARETAEEANRLKSEFLANMSHEIRTPMNGLLGMTQLLEMTDLTNDQHFYVTTLKESGNNLLSLLNDILDLSKIEAERMVLELSEFSLTQCIKDITLLQQHMLQNKGLILTIEHDKNIPGILVGDQLRVKQILSNLLGNAVKFTAQGNIAISTQLLAQTHGSALVQIAVRDTGIGISASALDDIFKPFVQEDGSITRKYGGTGLGLSICSRLAELMGGNIWAESALGVGSTFYVRIQFAVSQIMSAHPHKQKTDLSKLEWDGPPLRILIAEDNDINQKVMIGLINKLGLDSVIAQNGQEAFDLWKSEHFDLILMDIQMPVMNGKVATQKIRQIEQENGNHTTIIAMTAHALKQEQEHIMQQGFDGYLSKPIAYTAFLDELSARFAISNKNIPSCDVTSISECIAVEPVDLIPMLEEIQALLQGYSMAASSKVGELMILTPGLSEVKDLQYMVKKCDFPGALQTLTGIYKRLGISQPTGDING